MDMPKSDQNEYCRCGKLISEHEWRTKKNGKRIKICNNIGNVDTFSNRIEQASNIFSVEYQIGEKIVRINDILKMISTNSILKRSMVLIGGTAINMGIHGNNPPRLSMDLDFNYRNNEYPEGENHPKLIMETTKEQIVKMLQQLKYSLDNIKYKGRFELGQFTIFFTNEEGMEDFFKIEICYSRRIPLLKESDNQGDHFQQMKIVDEIYVFFPSKEELFAEKIAVLLRRHLIRDIFDVYSIYKNKSKFKTNKKLLRKCSLICILYQSIDPRTINFDQFFNDIKKRNFSKSALHLKNQFTKQSLEQMINDVKKFIGDVFSNFTDKENQYFDQYFNNNKFLPELIDPENDLHPELINQSEIEWLIKKKLEKL